MNITGTAASNQSKFFKRQLLSLPVQPSTVTLGTLTTRANSKPRSLQRRFTSPNARERLALIGGVTSSGGRIICEWLFVGLLDVALDIIHSYIGSVNYGAKAVLMWNIALDGNGQPQLPGSGSCQNPPCRGVVTINDGSFTLNEECGLIPVFRLRRGSPAV